MRSRAMRRSIGVGSPFILKILVVVGLGVCRICGRDAEKLIECLHCAAPFCKECGDVSQEVCSQCQEQITMKKRMKRRMGRELG